MALQQPRRAVLRTGGIVAASALAGCSAIPFVGDGENPDAGNDSYGIFLVNEHEAAHDVTITVQNRSADEQVFEESTSVEPDAEREWDQVLTEEAEYIVEAIVDAGAFYDQNNQNMRTVFVGPSSSPEVENVLVRVQAQFDGVTARVQLDPDDPP